MRAVPLALLLALAALPGCSRKPVVESEPQQLSETPFDYPEELWDAGVEGRTVLRIRVNAEGAVDSARVETPSGYSAFDSAALAGTPKLRFEPALRNGKPIPKWVLLPVDFDIAGTDSAAAGQDSAADGQLP